MSASPWILVVDDDPDVRQVMLILLGMEGYRALGAGDGLEALEHMRAHGRPALVLLDLRMPQMNGPELATALREDPALASVPIVVLSGDPGAPEIASSLGISVCLKKPIDLHELLGAVARAAAPPSAA